MKTKKTPNIRLTEQVIADVFVWAMQRHGFERAQVMFSNYGTEPNATEIENLRKFDLLKRLDAMEPPNVKKLVRELLAEHEIGPSHSDYEKERAALDKFIRRLKKDYRAALEAAHADTSPPVPKGEPARLKLIKRKG
jgi:FMN phosphatase YigB (HAD superfamily)